MSTTLQLNKEENQIQQP